MPVIKEVFCDECGQKMVTETLSLGKKGFVIYKCANGHVKSIEKKGEVRLFGIIEDETYEIVFETTGGISTIIGTINDKPIGHIVKVILSLSINDARLSIERRLDV